MHSADRIEGIKVLEGGVKYHSLNSSGGKKTVSNIKRLNYEPLISR